eukprot:Gb_08247 [translate_table: standard]
MDTILCTIQTEEEQGHLGRELEGDQLTKQEEKEIGDTGLNPYIDYLKQNKGFLYCSFAALSHLTFIAGPYAIIMQSYVELTFTHNFIDASIVGMAISYGLSLNMSLVFSVQNQCTLANYIVSVECIKQYMHIPSEAPTIIKDSQPPTEWPSHGEVELQKLKVHYGNKEGTP